MCIVYPASPSWNGIFHSRCPVVSSKTTYADLHGHFSHVQAGFFASAAETPPTSATRAES
ncbi:MAG: hypothetical protein SPG40_03690 [Kiritimatiellia bacterium]|nr:hypothetical protein [Kiritimatiellia bacterium]